MLAFLSTADFLEDAFMFTEFLFVVWLFYDIPVALHAHRILHASSHRCGSFPRGCFLTHGVPHCGVHAQLVSRVLGVLLARGLQVLFSFIVIFMLAFLFVAVFLMDALLLIEFSSAACLLYSILAAICAHRVLHVGIPLYGRLPWLAFMLIEFFIVVRLLYCIPEGHRAHKK